MNPLNSNTDRSKLAMIKIGHPIPKNVAGQSFSQSLTRSIKAGYRAFQVNMTSTHNSQKGKRLTGSESKEVLKLKNDYKLYGVVHGKYTYNFCRKECQYQIDLLVHELDLSADIECDVILHQGKNVKEENLTRLQAIDNYVKHISQALKETSHLKNGILLENSAQQGTEIGYSLNELAYIYKQFDDELKPRVGFCLDLCHIFVAGELDVRSASKVLDYFNQFDHMIGLNKLKVIHFNDSSVPFGAKHDRHGDIQCGYISNPLLGGHHEGFMMVAILAKQHNIGIIFETPCNFRQYHTVYSQSTCQLFTVKGWSEGDNSLYENYEMVVPQLKHIAYQYYQKLNGSKLDSCPCQHDHEIKEPAKQVDKIQIKLKDNTPKIKIKLKPDILIPAIPPVEKFKLTIKSKIP